MVGGPRGSEERVGSSGQWPVTLWYARSETCRECFYWELSSPNYGEGLEADLAQLGPEVDGFDFSQDGLGLEAFVLFEEVERRLEEHSVKVGGGDIDLPLVSLSDKLVREGDPTSSVVDLDQVEKVFFLDEFELVPGAG